MRCEKGESNPHGASPLAPKTSASTNSAILAKLDRDERGPLRDELNEELQPRRSRSASMRSAVPPIKKLKESVKTAAARKAGGKSRRRG